MFNINDVVYPEKIARRLAALRHDRTVEGANANAASANFRCGSFVRFSLTIDPDSRTLTEISFSSNGCGFMLVAADCIAESFTEKRLTDLHGLADADLHERIQKHFGNIPSERRDCIAACTDALRLAFADFRKTQIEEFQGEKALICTCFTVTEETIASILLEPGAIATGFLTVEEITRATGAGGGCGSCLMLIQEMLDRAKSQF